MSKLVHFGSGTWIDPAAVISVVANDACEIMGKHVPAHVTLKMGGQRLEWTCDDFEAARTLADRIAGLCNGSGE